MKKHYFAVLFLISLTSGSNLAFAGSLIPDRTITVPPPTPQTITILAGKNWAYTVPFQVKSSTTIEKLIQCESQGVNISRPDSNHRISDGLLQFNRGPSDTLGSGTWDDMERRFDFYGSPIIPNDAIHMADLMISGGFLGRWTCSKIMGLN